MTAYRERELAALQRGSEALLGLIRGEQFGSRTPDARRQRAEAKLARTRTLLAALGDPHRNYRVVHVTGTSGKGSTSATLAAILSAAGYRVGLRTSPYMQVPTEKLQIGSSLVDAIAFERLARSVLDVGHRLFPSADTLNRIGYSEAWTAMSMLWFAERAIDIAVVEVGAGGRFDSTNVVDPSVSVITSVGLDHVVSLGPALSDIAWHKAGIIKRGSMAVIGEVAPELSSIFERESESVGAPIRRVTTENLPLGFSPTMSGAFQRSNMLVALATTNALIERGLSVPVAAIQAGLSCARLPGRLERMPGHTSPPVWIDGAHNEDKIAALAAEAPKLSPGSALPVVVVGMLGSKDLDSIADRLVPAASAFVTTQPTVFGKRARDAGRLAQALRECGFAGRIVTEPEPLAAVREAEEIAGTLGTIVLVAGSIYLAGEVRRRWFPDEEIVLQRTPWPSIVGSGGSRLP